VCARDTSRDTQKEREKVRFSLLAGLVGPSRAEHAEAGLAVKPERANERARHAAFSTVKSSGNTRRPEQRHKRSPIPRIFSGSEKRILVVRSRLLVCSGYLLDRLPARLPACLRRFVCA
jgi:hypothetical protein